MKIDAVINDWFEPVAEALASVIFYSVSIAGHDIMLILVWLAFASIFFTLYLGFINVRLFSHAWGLIFGTKSDADKQDGQISPFQALATSLSGTVGLGNIAGVAVAVSVGGPGAAFWMLLMGLFGMSTKFSEVMLGVKYRKHTDGTHPERISGGPMYYLKEVFDRKEWPYFGSIMGGFFALCAAFGAFGAGSLFQTNQVFQQAVTITGGAESIIANKGWLIGLIMAALVGIVIIGGIKSIGAVAGRLVPAMGVLYLFAGLFVLAMHYAAIPDAIVTIFREAFTPAAGSGAIIGALLMGVQRASFSNEAGLGTAAIAHSAAQTSKPVTQGMIGMLGPFIDTVIICMVTALVIIVTGAYSSGDGMEGVELTSRAFADGASWLPYVLFVVVALFAYSTLISWSYYGVKGFTYLFGNSALSENFYKLIFCLFIVVGASSDLSGVILFTDSVVFAMAIPNIIGLYFFAPEIKKDVKAYISELKK